MRRAYDVRVDRTGEIEALAYASRGRQQLIEPEIEELRGGHGLCPASCAANTAASMYSHSSIN